MLLAHEPRQQVKAADRDGWTALMMAADNGHLECIDRLLGYEASVQVLMGTAKERQTALHSAAYKGHHKCLERLLQLMIRLQPEMSMEERLSC